MLSERIIYLPVRDSNQPSPCTATYEMLKVLLILATSAQIILERLQHSETSTYWLVPGGDMEYNIMESLT